MTIGKKSKNWKTPDMWDWAEAFIAAACLVAFVIYGTYIIAWSLV